MDERLDQAPIVRRFAEAAQPVADVVAFYVGGSLALGDFRPGVSDLDLVAVVSAELDDRRRDRLRVLHQGLLQTEPAAEKLHCVYAVNGELTDLAAEHWRWAHGELYRAALSGIARAELLLDGITVYGPPPADLVPGIDTETLRRAARAELTGYWSGAVRKPRLWWQDVYVDIGLLTLARAETTLREGRLITKQEALGRLDHFGVPTALVEEIARRRAGETVVLSRVERVVRALRARRLMARGIRALT